MAFEITHNDWVLFENMFDMKQDAVDEIPNMYRHPCRLFVAKKNMSIYIAKSEQLKNMTRKMDIFADNSEIRHLEQSIRSMIYHISPQHRWSQSIIV